MPGAEDVHAPPPGVPVSVVEPGKQILGVPDMVGCVPTVRLSVDVHPLDVSTILVVPLEIPVTTPVADTVAIPGADDDHTPAVDPVSASVEGIHSVVAPAGVITGSIAVLPKIVTVNPLAVA
jgi:hypothetical protein